MMGADPDTKTDGNETTIKDGLRIKRLWRLVNPSRIV